MDDEIKTGEMTGEIDESITVEEDFTLLEGKAVSITDDSDNKTSEDEAYEEALEIKESLDDIRQQIKDKLLDILEKGRITDADGCEIELLNDQYTEKYNELKDVANSVLPGGKGASTSTTNTSTTDTTEVVKVNIDYDEILKAINEKADWLYIDEDGQVMLNGEVVPKLKVVELEAEKIKADVGEFKNLTTENFTATNATIENLKANKADIEYLNANYATIQNLNATNANVDNLKTDKANITDLNATNAEIDNLKANKANITDLQATNAKITNLEANKADIDVLEANYATINLLNSNTAIINNALIDKANVSDLNATNANVTNLQATKANVTDLNAANANINTLTGNLADITTLVNGNLTSDNIQSMVITGDKFTVANGFIKNAMIDSINANKITTGTINTNNVNIQSSDGSMVINGNTQQFKDGSGRVRIQIGKDASGNFTFALFSQDGVGVLIDENGIKSGAVPNGLIVNDMVADGANISGSKLDINSVISSINNGTTVIKGTRIQLDEQGQSLQVAFSQLKNKVETIENISIEGDLSSVIEQVTSNTTNITTMQGQISSLISNTTITKANGEVVQLKDEYNSTKDTVNSHTQKIGSLTTNLATANNNISSVQSKQTALEQNLNGFKTTVSDTYTTKADFNNLTIGGRNFLRTTGTAKTYTVNTSTGSNNFVTYDPYTTHNSQTLSSLGLKVGDKITVSFDWSLSNITTAGNFRVETIQDSTYKSLISGPHNFGSNTSGRYVGTKVLTDVDININKIRIRVDASNLTMTIKNMKLEKGNKVTSWSPAPEDIDSAISTVDSKFTNYSTTTQMNSAINQKANEITSTVSETYATKTSLTTVDNKFANYSTTSAMNSAINQKSDSILSTVSSTYTTKTDFNNLNVGGRNFVVNSGFKGVVPNTQTFPHWSYWGNVMVFGGQGNPNYNAVNTLYLQNHTDVLSGIWQDIPSSKIPKNTEITISYDMSREGNVIGSYTTLEFYDTDLNRLDTIQLADATGHVVRTVTTPNIDYSVMRFVIGHNGTNSNSGYLVIVGNIKIEKGNRATDWSPAPEDTDNAIDVVDSKFNNYSTTQQMNSAINQKANEITSTVSETYATKSSLKATDDKFANYSTTSAMNSAINQKGDSILSTVSSTYTTKSDFNNLTIGGRNYIRNAGFKDAKPNSISTLSNWTSWGDINIYSNQGNSGYNKPNTIYLQNRGTSGAGIWQDISSSLIPPNTECTLSYFCNKEANVTSCDVFIEYYDNNNNRITTKYFGIGANTIKTTTFTTHSSYSKLRVVITHNGTKDSTGGYLVVIGNIKLEKGKKATDFSFAPEDTDNAIDVVDSKFNNYSTTQQMNSAIEQKANEITSTVSETYATKTALKDTDDKFADYSTTTQMNSAINQKANEITSTVSETYATKTTTNNMLSQIQQNANSISTKVDVNGVISSINQSSETIAINANKINLNGYVSNDNANWSIDNEGNMKAENLKIEGEVGADVLSVNYIDNPCYPATLAGSIDLYINADTGNDDYTIDDILQSYDEAEEKNNDSLKKKFKTIQGAIDAIPKFLNNKTVYITMETNSTEDVYIRGAVGGAIRIYMNGKTLFGTLRSYACSATITTYGGTKDNTEGTVSIIHPSVGLSFGSRAVSVGFEASQYCAIYKVKVFAPDNLPSDITNTDKVCVASQAGTGSVYCKNVEIVNAVIGFRSNNHGSMHVNSSSGVASKYGFQSATGGIISIANNSQCGGKTSATNKNGGGQIWYDDGKPKFATGNQTTDSGTAPVVSTTKTMTIKSSYGDTYRSSVYDNWKKDGTVRQGDYGYGDCTGCWFFGTAFSELKGKTITKVQITIKRQTGGSSVPVEHKLWMHGHTVRPSGAPKLTSGWSQTFRLATGNSTTVLITNSAVLNAISAGTCRGFALRNTYDSAHYSVCSGSVTVKITYTE